jgi:hypothetical protein
LETKPPTSKSTNDFPFYVRALAVAHVLLRIIGPLGFWVLLIVSGCVWWLRGKQVDATVIGLMAAALACPLLCAVFRACVTAWGRKYWPGEENATGSSSGE